MKVFYSELVANPAYYSFGYAIYGLLEEGDSLAACYDRGFLPFVGAEAQPERTLYQARSVRVLAPEFKEGHYHRYALKKAEPYLKDVTVTEYERSAYPDPAGLEKFLASYFRFRFGRDAMPAARLRAVLASPLLTHIVEYRTGNEIVGYVLETRGEGFHHVWYFAYAKKYERHCVGLYLCIDFVRRVAKAEKRYAYFGATYGLWMKYKTHFEPLEYWDGEQWRRDPKGSELKKLMAGDPLRQLAFVDRWREGLGSFFTSPYPFDSARTELRFLTLVAAAAPRAFAAFAFFVLFCCALIILASLT